MDERRWEDLQADCLVNIFGRVGMESLLLDVPFVCKSWYKATLDPQCWKILRFPIDYYYEETDFGEERMLLQTRLVKECKLNDDADIVAFTKFVIKRSKKAAVFLWLPRLSYTEDMYSFVATECPDLKYLLLPQHSNLPDESPIPNLVSKLNLLQQLAIPGHRNLKDIVTQISMHCKDFYSLCVMGARIEKDEASAIANLLSNLKCLVLRNADMEKDDMMTILQGCKQLVLFDGSNCRDFSEDDEDIIELASHIPQFNIAGSELKVAYDYFFDENDPDFLNTVLSIADLIKELPEPDTSDISLL